jgi:CRISPR/Cas system CMR-associated protein Cmr3 (group 5 of RAMP superfamily)
MTGTEYLEANLLPLVLSIQPKQMNGYTMKTFLGLERISKQSIVISLGNHLETFWNKVISDAINVNNLIELNNMVNVAGKLRQVDHYFEDIDQGVKLYLESKCNLDFDSEKSKSSNSKILQVQEALGADLGAYFVPTTDVIDHKDLVKYNNKGVQVYGVEWILQQVDAQFTCAEYFTFGREVVASILEEKGL